MQIIKEYTDTDNIKIQLFFDETNRPRIWIFDIEKPNDRLDKIYPSLEAAEKDYAAYIDGIEGE